jgi:hypothetical protein
MYNFDVNYLIEKSDTMENLVQFIKESNNDLVIGSLVKNSLKKVNEQLTVSERWIPQEVSAKYNDFLHDEEMDIKTLNKKYGILYSIASEEREKLEKEILHLEEIILENCEISYKFIFSFFINNSITDEEKLNHIKSAFELFNEEEKYLFCILFSHVVRKDKQENVKSLFQLIICDKELHPIFNQSQLLFHDFSFHFRKYDE